jgi:small conductance mechanosensitive channel
VGVDYDANIETTRQALQDAADVFVRETIHGEGRGTAIVLSNLGDNAVEWKVRMWVHSTDYWALQESLTSEVKRQLDLVDIGIPYPQMDIHLTRADNTPVKTPVRPRIRPLRRDAASDKVQSSVPHAA